MSSQKEEREKTNNKKEENISFLVPAIRVCLNFSPRDFSEPLLITVDELQSIDSLANTEISTELLFRFYYMADTIINNIAFDSGIHSMAKDLKKQCNEEICRRS